MKIERTCKTCYENKRNCSYIVNDGCLLNNLCEWKPYTNLEHLQNMNSVQFANWMEQCKNGKGVTGLICRDLKDNCYYGCTHNHFCEGKYTYTDTDVIIKWLNSPVEVDE